MGAKRRTGSKLKTALLLLMIPTGFILAMNLFWLGFSTTRVSIADRGLAGVKIVVNDHVIDLGDMRRGESRFMFLPKVGRGASYSITFVANNYTRTACEVEVDETKHHVEATLYPGRESVCTVSEPMFSGLMVSKFF